MVNPQTMAMIQPTPVQPANRVTIQMAPRLWCPLIWAMIPGNRDINVAMTIKMSSKKPAAALAAASLFSDTVASKVVIIVSV